MTQSGEYYSAERHVLEGSNDLLDLSNANLSMLSNYQGFIFSSPERLKVHRHKVEAMARALLAFVDKMEGNESPSLLKGIRYKLFGFLSSLETFSGVPFTGKWYSNLRSMKFGKKVAHRVKKSFAVEKLKPLVPFNYRSCIREPSDVLSFVARKGRSISVNSSGASEIEPWLVHVDYVSPDKTKTTMGMLTTAENGVKVRDSKGRLVTDVLLEDDTDDVAKLYVGFVFSRTPYLYLPSQYPALVDNAFSSCIEEAFKSCVKISQPANGEKSERGGEPIDQLKSSVKESLTLAIELLGKVRDRMNSSESSILLQNIKEHDDIEAFLTTKNMIQSVN